MSISIEEAKARKPDGRLYQCEFYSVWADKRSCFFCDHLTDIWWDYTNGPYMFRCARGHDDALADPDGIRRGMRGECPDFTEEKT